MGSNLAAIALGGSLGAVLRYGVSVGAHSWLGRGFPWGTLIVNAVGSFLMGLLAVLLVERLALAPEWRAAILVGFLGSFTTFSTFSLETLTLMEQGEGTRAAANVVASVAICLFAAWGGLIAGRAV